MKTKKGNLESIFKGEYSSQRVVLPSHKVERICKLNEAEMNAVCICNCHCVCPGIELGYSRGHSQVGLQASSR